MSGLAARDDAALTALNDSRAASPHAKNLAVVLDGISKSFPVRRTWGEMLRHPGERPRAPVLQALATPTGIRLTWQAPAPPASAHIAGYNVYRKRSGGVFPLTPLTSPPLTGTLYEDDNLEQEVRYVYVVQTVALTDGQTVESDPSNEVESARAEPE